MSRLAPELKPVCPQFLKVDRLENRHRPEPAVAGLRLQIFVAVRGPDLD